MAKAYDEYTFKEKLIFKLHNENAFECKEKLHENEFHLCRLCKRRAELVLMFFEFELGNFRRG